MLVKVIIPLWITLTILYILFFMACRKLAKEDEKRAHDEAVASIEYSKHCNDNCKYCNIRINCVAYRRKNTGGQA